MTLITNIMNYQRKDCVSFTGRKIKFSYNSIYNSDL
nr:MAG TPA: hypothetical protein [Crassvirales sp.]